MELIIYTAIYIIGVFLGSFFTLATYRIPLKQDILYTRSYCPKCKNKLKWIDLTPILSYVFLKGKCRYCKEEISPRYIIIEAFTGLFYLLFIMSLKIDVYNISLMTIITLLFITLNISTLFILGAIEKENKVFSKGVLNFGIIVEAIYIIYLYVLNYNIYRYVIYLLIFILLTLIQFILKQQDNYTLNILKLCLILAIWSGEILTVITIICSILLGLINYIAIQKRRTTGKVPIAFYLCFTNMLINLTANYLIR